MATPFQIDLRADFNEGTAEIGKRRCFGDVAQEFVV
jgi:hypothetical protein